MDIGRPKDMTHEEYIEELKGYMKLFTDVNPDCKFIYSIPSGAYWYKNADRADDAYIGRLAAKEIAKLDNVIVVDWGRLVYDLIKGNATVPGSNFTYDATSFIVDDGYHPNLLAGYINTLMTYCAITGETAVGQPTHLENGLEGSMAKSFKMTNFESYYYRETSSNFIDIMNSESEMRGIQILIDRYLDMDAYLSF